MFQNVNNQLFKVTFYVALVLRNGYNFEYQF